MGVLVILLGLVRAFAQLPDAPDAPGAPSFDDITSTTLQVTAPALPARAAHLTLQRKLSTEADTEYANVSSGIVGSGITVVQGLSAATAYRFRYVAVGEGGSTEGSSEEVTTDAATPTVTAQNDAYPMSEGDALTITAPGVLDNDTGPTGITLTAQGVTQPQHGTLTLNGNGSFVYTPESTYSGSDSFTYRAKDGALASAVVRVLLTVNPTGASATNHAPDAQDANVSTDEDTALTSSVTAPDADADTVTFTATTQPQHGTLDLGTDGSYTYTPSADYNGADSFGFTANDGTVDSPTGIVSITVNAVNDAPTATDCSVSTAAETPAAVDLIAADADGDPLTYEIINEPEHGTLSGTAPALTYTAEADYYGDDSFTFKVNDGTADSEAATVSLSIAPPVVPPPANDNFADAQVLSGGSGTTSETWAGATRETDEPQHAGTWTNGSVWYKWTAPSSGTVNFDTFGSSFDTALAVYTGTALDALTEVASNDDYHGNNSSKVSFEAVEGTDYLIAFAGYSFYSGTAKVNWGPPPPPPSNDNFADAQILTDPSGTVSGTTTSATRETDEPDHAGNHGSCTVWYGWTATSSGPFSFSTVGSLLDTTLGVYTGTAVDALTEVTSDDDSGGDGTSKARFEAVEGTQYWIAVAGYGSNSGDIVFNWGPPPPPPANDNFSDAEEITGDNGYVSGTNESATAETGEPDHLDAATASVWYKWTPTQNGFMAFSSYSSYDSVVAVYTGTAVDGLTRVADTSMSGTAVFPAVAGTTYYLAYDSYNGTGDLELDWGAPYPNAPGQPRIGTVTQNSIHINPIYSWQLATLYADTLELQTKQTFDFGADFVTIPCNEDGSADVTGLAPGTGYEFRYHVVNTVGEDYSGTNSAFTTAQVLPDAPGAPTFSDVKSTSLKVHLPALPGNAVSLTLQRAQAATAGTVPTRSSLPEGAPQLWFRADSLPYAADGSTVLGWANSAGGGNATRVGSGVGPLWNGSGGAGRPVVHIQSDGGAFKLPTVAADFSGGMTSFVVARPSAPESKIPFWTIARTTSTPGTDADHNGFVAGHLGDTSVYDVYENSVLVSNLQTPNGAGDSALRTYCLSQAPGDPGTQSLVTFYENGEALGDPALANVPKDTSYNDSYLGVDSMHGGQFNGDIAEVLIYNTELSSTDRAAVEAYLAGKYTLAAPAEGLEWTTLATEQAGHATYDETELTASTAYYYRCIAVNADGSTVGPVAGVTTAEPSGVAPAAPEAPTFADIASTSANVTAPALPTGAYWMKLQHKLASQADSEYQDVKDVVGPGEVTFAEGLPAETEQVFRYVAMGDGQQTSGTAATLTTIATPIGTGYGLRGTYYRSPDFNNLIFARLDSQINFNWGTGSPGPDVPKDDFAVVWEGKIEPKFTENYVFNGDVDDQVKLWINDQLVIDHMYIRDFADVYRSAPILLHQGQQYNIKMQFHERDGSAHARLLWSSASQSESPVPSTQLYPAPLPPINKNDGHGLTGHYFDTAEFTNQKMTRIDPEINFNWGGGSPAGDISPESFSVDWAGELDVPADSTYAFTADADDVARICIDGHIVYDGFYSIGNRLPIIKTVRLLAGHHYDFAVQFIEYCNSAHINLHYADMADTDPGLEISDPQGPALPREWLSPNGIGEAPSLSEGDKIFDSADWKSDDMPLYMEPGQSYDVHMVLKANLTAAWSPPGDPGDVGLAGYWPPERTYHLVSQQWNKNRLWNVSKSDDAHPDTVTVKDYLDRDVAPRGNYGLSGLRAFFNSDIFGPPVEGTGGTFTPPEQDITFVIHVKAPMEPGIYPFQWKMADPIFEPDGFPNVTPLKFVTVLAPTPSRTLTVEKTTATTAQLKLPELYDGSTGWTLQRAVAPSVTATPPTSGLALWLKPEGLANLSPTGKISSWPNAAGGTSAVQTNSGHRPTYIPGAVNGLGVASFDGAHNFLQLPSGFANFDAGLSAFVLMQPSAATDNSRVLDLGNDEGSDDVSLSRYGTGNNAYYFVHNADTEGALSGSDALIGNGWRSLAVIQQGAAEGADPGAATSTQTYKDGAALNTGDVALPGNVTRISNLVGKSNHDDALFKGQIAEVLLYNRAVTPTERTDIESYLAYKYDLSASTYGLTWTNVATGQLGSTTYTDDGLTAATRYWYRVVPEGTTDPNVGPAEALTQLPAPDAPAAPDLISVTDTTATFGLPVAPARATSMELEYREVEDPTEQWVRVRDDQRTETQVLVSDLDATTAYSFRWVAEGPGGETPGAQTAVTTSLQAPDAPDAPDFRVDDNPDGPDVLHVIMPALPEGATTLSLQQRFSTEADGDYTTVAENAPGDSEVELDSLTYGSYLFRVIAVGAGGQTIGPAAGIELQSPPAAPEAPSITFTGPTSVNVTAPAFTEYLRLQVKLLGQSDDYYSIVADSLSGGSVTPYVEMIPGQTYVFRYLGRNRFNNGGMSIGATAQVTVPLPTTTWAAGSPIACNGIRFPLPNEVVGEGTEKQLFSFVATDWDNRLSTAGAFTTVTRHTDPCTYNWSASGGTFKNGVHTGQTAIWIAPGTGTYTLTLTIDDRNGANVGNGEAGTRNDTDGFDDAPLHFTTTVTVP